MCLFECVCVYGTSKVDHRQFVCQKFAVVLLRNKSSISFFWHTIPDPYLMTHPQKPSELFRKNRLMRLDSQQYVQIMQVNGVS